MRLDPINSNTTPLAACIQTHLGDYRPELSFIGERKQRRREAVRQGAAEDQAINLAGSCVISAYKEG